MIAYRLVQPQEPPQLQDVAKPSPGAGQLLIKVGGCGLCHTDIGLMTHGIEASDDPILAVRRGIYVVSVAYRTGGWKGRAAAWERGGVSPFGRPINEIKS